MSVSPLPRRGGVQRDARDDNRVLRVAGHPETGSCVLSLWRGNECVASHHVAAGDVPELIKLLASAIVQPTPDHHATAS